MKHKILSVLYSVSIFVLICLGSCKKEPPTRAYAGEDQYVYDTNVVVLDGNKATSGTGEWNILKGSGGVIEDPENPNSVFRGSYNGTYVLRWTIRNSIGFSNDDVTIAFFNAVAFTGKDSVVVYDDTTCQLTAQEPSEGTGHWEIISGQNGNIDDIYSPKATLTGHFGNTYVLRWTVENPGPNDTAVAYDEMQVTFVIDQLYPHANILIPDTIVFSSTNISLAAETPDIGNGVWTIIDGAGGGIGTPDNPNSSFDGSLDAAYTLKWTVTNRYGEDADTVDITFSSPVSAEAGQDKRVLSNASGIFLDPSTPPPGGTGEWTFIQGQGAAIRNDTFYAGYAHDSIVYILEWSVSNFNQSASDADRVTIVVAFECGTNDVKDQDNNYYNTINIGNQCWMKENLNVGQMILSSSDQSNNSTIEKYCYDDDANNCATCGGLYQWNEMMQYLTAESVQGICPEGWHIPSDDEWKTLEMSLGMSLTDANKGGWRGSPIGTSLKQGGASGFDALLCGRCSETKIFLLNGSNGYIQSSTQSNENMYIRGLEDTSGEVGRINEQPKTAAFSVRCIQD